MNDIKEQNPVLNAEIDIKERLELHRLKIREMAYQKQRIGTIEASMLPASPRLSDMPKGGGHTYDASMLDAMVRIAEIEEAIAELLVEVDDERRELERLINNAIKIPERKQIVRMRYFDDMSWDEISIELLSDVSYKEIIYQYHSRALQDLRRLIKQENPEISRFIKKITYLL